YRKHVRMQIDMTGSRTGNGERKANHCVALERSHHLASDLVRHDEHAQRDQVCVAKIPDLFLQDDAGAKLVDILASAQFDLVHRHALCSPAPPAFSYFLAFCQSDSSSSTEAWSAVRPDSCNRSSIHWNRLLNLRFVLRSADSASTDR